MASNNYFGNYYHQSSLQNDRPPSNYQSRVHPFNAVQHSYVAGAPRTEPEPINHNPNGHSQIQSRTSYQRTQPIQDYWTEQRANLNTTHAAEALRHLGGYNNGRPADINTYDNMGYNANVELNQHTARNTSRDHSQPLNTSRQAYHPGQRYDELRSSTNTPQAQVPGVYRPINTGVENQQDHHLRRYSGTDMLDASRNIQRQDHSGEEVHRVPNNQALHPARISQPYQANDGQQVRSPVPLVFTGNYAGEVTAGAGRTLPPVTSSDRGNGFTQPSHVYGQSSRQPHDNADKSQNDTTVDPTKVYNPWQEFQRRQTTAQDASERQPNIVTSDLQRENVQQPGLAFTQGANPSEMGNDRISYQSNPDMNNHEHQRNEPAEMRDRSSLSSTPISAQRNNAPASTKDEVEAEVKAMMTKLRELSSKDPTLLAQIWEQERKAQTSSKTKEKPVDLQRQLNGPSVGESRNAEKAQKSTSDVAASEVQRSMNPSVSNIQYSQKPKAAPKSNEVAGPKDSRTPTDPLNKGTEWPPDKKVHVAAAASECINKDPENKDRYITSHEISALLDTNPSYIELCEVLESRGFRIARGSLARSLLTAVPDINSSASTSRPVLPDHKTQQGNTSNSKKRSIEAPSHASFKSLSQSASRDKSLLTENSSSRLTYQDANAEKENKSPEQAANVTKSSTQSNFEKASTQTSKLKNNSQTSQSAPKPVSKEEAARKRNFDEIVDLSLLSDEEVGPPAKKIATENTTHSVDTKESEVQDLGALQAVHDFLHPAKPEPVAAQDSSISSKPPPRLGIDENLKNVLVANIIDRKKALRRSTYSTTTIARDVLLATGKHPEMARLNAHLEPLLITFRRLDSASDLNTLRWDIIDPGNPLIDTSLNPDYMNESADEGEEDEPEGNTTVRTQNINGGDGVAQILTVVRTPSAITNPILKKRRGRPPKHASSGHRTHPYGYEGGHVTNSGTAGTPSSVNPRNAPPNVTHTPTPVSAGNSEPQGPSSTTRTNGYVAFRNAVAADGTPLPKKKGRPVGWRKYPTASSTPNSAQSPGSGRQPSSVRQSQPVTGKQKNSKTGDEEPVRSELRFRIFKCLWTGCSAELHNLETLTKHVIKIHCKAIPNDTYECLWSTCGTVMDRNVNSGGEETTIMNHISFASQSDLIAHVEKAHLSAVAWSLGDGPAAGLSGKLKELW